LFAAFDGLADSQHGYLRAAGVSSRSRRAELRDGQLMLQAGLRVGEVASLRVADLTMNDRSGSVRIRSGKGHKAREIPLNATIRRARRRLICVNIHSRCVIQTLFVAYPRPFSFSCCLKVGSDEIADDYELVNTLSK
jgi:integrase